MFWKVVSDNNRIGLHCRVSWIRKDGSIGSYSSDNNRIGLHCSVSPADVRLNNSILENGTQVLRVPSGSHFDSMVLKGGASHLSSFADIRGAVVKFHEERSSRSISVVRVEVPSSHTLMDEESLKQTRQRNRGDSFPFEVVSGNSELLYQVHASYCHPDNLLLPQGTFTKTTFHYDAPDYCGHRNFTNGVFSLHEVKLVDEIIPELNLPQDYSPICIPNGCQVLIIKLKEGGFIRREK